MNADMTLICPCTVLIFIVFILTVKTTLLLCAICKVAAAQSQFMDGSMGVEVKQESGVFPVVWSVSAPPQFGPQRDLQVNLYLLTHTGSMFKPWRF